MASMPSRFPSRPGERRERDGEVQRALLVLLARHLEGAYRMLAGQRGAGRPVRLLGEEVGERAADGVLSHRAEDAVGGGVPALNAAVGVEGDDRVSRGADQPLEGLLGLRHLAVQAGVADGDGEVLGQHLEQLALARIDGPRAGPVGGDQVAQRGGIVADGADDRRAGGDVLGHRGAQVHRDLVVAERLAELRRDRRGELGEVELAEDAPRDLAQDRKLGDPERLFRLFPARDLFEPAGLGR